MGDLGSTFVLCVVKVNNDVLAKKIILLKNQKLKFIFPVKTAEGFALIVSFKLIFESIVDMRGLRLHSS